MIREFPICSSACMIFPSGLTARDFSSAPRLFLYQSIACAALSKMSCGVTVWNPSGTGLFAFAIVPPYPPILSLSERRPVTGKLIGEGGRAGCRRERSQGVRLLRVVEEAALVQFRHERGIVELLRRVFLH